MATFGLPVLRPLASGNTVIPPDLRIAALALGVILCLAAILCGVVLRKAARTALGRFARWAIAVSGIALLAWALASYRAPRPQLSGAVAPRAPAVGPSARELVGIAATALEACSQPTAPAVPHGAQTSLQQMEAARSAFAAYDAATNAYTQCVDATIARTSQRFAGVASESDLQALNTFGTRAHNAAIEQEKAIVDQFNAQVRTYNATHPK
ncbi:MAG: hypothetical protein KGJ68_09295 [Gammaproteobacteria bacterium]|nr:hypothetical protein [Gammaproteobacteria bacterium]